MGATIGASGDTNNVIPLMSSRSDLAGVLDW